MPEFESRKKPAPKKKAPKKKQNLVVGIVSGLVPWKGDTKGDVVRKLVFLLSIGVLVAASLILLNFYVFRDMSTTAELERWTQLRKENSSDDMVTIRLEDDESKKTDDPEAAAEEVEVLEEYLPYYEENNEYIGWVSIPPYVNYPVAQADDNEFYLKHNFDKVPTENGTIFADYESKIAADGNSANVILYGHNLITNNYFQPLGHYKEIDFLKDNPTVVFDTLYQRGTYKIFAVFLTNTLDAHGEVFDYYNHINFENKSEFDGFVAECLDRSYYYTGVDVQYGDELLTLSTCDFEMFSDMRLVVVARKVRDNESPLMDTDSFIDNTGYTADGLIKRKMFTAFYDTYKTNWAGRQWDTSYIKDFKG